jgi:hypothetical protein
MAHEATTCARRSKVQQRQIHSKKKGYPQIIGTGRSTAFYGPMILFSAVTVIFNSSHGLQPRRKLRCYRLAFLFVVGYNHFYVFRCCHLSIVFCLACVSVVLFFLKRWKFFKNNFSFVSALQALLKTWVECRVERFLIELAN